MFKDRHDAGEKLARELRGKISNPAIVLAIPRGGVVVAASVAEELQLPLDIIIPKKIGAPYHPEVAVGAVTQDGTAIYNEFLMARLGITAKDLESSVERNINEINRRMTAYRGKADGPDLAGKNVILVDDGIATGSTVMAALKSLQNSGSKSIILAVPVASPDAVSILRQEVDILVCLESSEPFYAVGQFYENFAQTDDDEVINLLKRVSYIKVK